jgi:hypothetical protein
MRTHNYVNVVVHNDAGIEMVSRSREMPYSIENDISLVRLEKRLFRVKRPADVIGCPSKPPMREAALVDVKFRRVGVPHDKSLLSTRGHRVPLYGCPGWGGRLPTCPYSAFSALTASITAEKSLRSTPLAQAAA